MTKLVVRGLTFSYSSPAVLDNVSFEAGEGECVAVLGKNGAGKSTLLKCIGHILPHCKGEVFVDGVEVNRIAPYKRAKIVGYVQQHLDFADSSVFDTVLLGRMPHMHWEPAEEDLQIVDAILASLELDGLAMRSVNALSGGEQQKVSIARALAQEPKLLLFDEPTSSLDLKSQMELVRLIRRIAREKGLSAIVSMHDINLALRFADSFLFLKDSRVHARGGMETITAKEIGEVYSIDADVVSVNGQTMVVPK